MKDGVKAIFEDHKLVGVEVTSHEAASKLLSFVAVDAPDELEFFLKAITVVPGAKR